MINIFDPRTLKLPMPFDSKLYNYFLAEDGGSITIETIPQYLSRVAEGDRSLGVIITILLPKDGHSAGTFPIENFNTNAANFDNKYYSFKEGLTDGDFEEIIFGIDEKVKYDAADPTAGYLADKIVAGTGISISEGTGGDENKLKITNTVTAYIPKEVTGLTLSSTGWSLVSGLYEYDLSNANITSTAIVDVIPDNADIDIVKAAEILPRTESSTGSVKIYSTNEPTADIGVTINIFEATT